MRPYRLVGRSTYRPYATFMLLMVAVAVMIWEIGLSSSLGTPFEQLVNEYAFVTCHVGQEPLSETLIDGVRSLFLHTSFVGFITNMLFLWVFAPRVEEYMGQRWFLALFLLAGIGGHIMSWAFQGDCLVVFDPSASISGVLAAFLILYPTKRVEAFIPMIGRSLNLPVIVYIIGYLGMQIFTDGGGPLSGQVSPYWDELGGFLMGLLIILGLMMFRPAPKVGAFDYLDD